MITIVTRWDATQMTSELEWRIWRQIKGAFSVDRFVLVPIDPEMSTVLVDQYDTMKEALTICVGKKVFLEPTGSDSLSDIPVGDVTLILGNTLLGNANLVTTDDLVVKIKSKKSTDLYGVNAAAIALAVMHGQ